MNRISFRGPSRRDALKLAAAGVAAPHSGLLPALAAHAAESKKKHKACIVCWMAGGPPHHESWDPKTEGGADYNSQCKPIRTSVPGIQVAETFPKMAGLMQHAAVLRGMSTKFADHGQGRAAMHQGVTAPSGGLIHPVLGGVVAHELGETDSALPNFIACGEPGRREYFVTGGFLGPKYDGTLVVDANKGLENRKPLVPAAEFDGRMGLLGKLEDSFAAGYPKGPAEAHRAAVAQAMRLMRSDKERAFDLNEESAATRDRYGRSLFGQGCLLARRLVEAGVPFIEVSDADYDSHSGQKQIISTQYPRVDQGMAALVADLKDRGMLDDVLIVWVGEFGRTPLINKAGGRDHYAKAWSTLMVGGGIKGGHAIGKTDAKGAEVTDRPITEKDWFATILKVLGIDPYKKVNVSDGRKHVTWAEEGAIPIKELL